MSVFHDLLGRIIGQQVDGFARWVRDSKLRIVGFVLLISVIIAVARKIDILIDWILAQLVISFNYLWLLLSRASVFDIITITLLICIVLYLGNTEAKRKRYRVDLRSGISQWSIQPNSQWTITKDKDVTGRVLSVTQSGYPGILKHGLNWYDYILSFQTKIVANQRRGKDVSNFTFAIRAKDRLNGVFFQCTEDILISHLISDGIFIIDGAAEYQLPFRIPTGEWVNVLAKVRGDFVDIFIEKERITYRIPTALYGIPMSSVSPTMYLKDIQQSHDQRIKQEAMRARALKPDPQKPSSDIEQTHYFSLEFDRGTIGFRESGNEQALFRNIQISDIS